MYRAGRWKLSIGALGPFNAFMLTKSPRTLGVLKAILWSFQALLLVWLVCMVTVAIAAVIMKRKVDVRTPRVAPRVPPRERIRPATAEPATSK